MKKQSGMTLIEVMVALVVFALAGLAEKTLASWLADNQLVQLRLENRWPALSWSETTLQAAGVSWHIRWQGVETDLPQLRALDVEVRHAKSDKTPVSSLRTYVTSP